MRRTDAFQIRIEPELRDRLARLRDERHVNVSAWARDVIVAALDREFPADLEAPTRQPLAGWRPCKLDDGWGAVLDGPDVAAARGGSAWNPDQHHRQSRRLLDGYDHRGRLPQPAAHRRPRLRPAVGVHALLDTLLVAQDEGIKRDREHQELPEGDDEEPGGDEETVGARSDRDRYAWSAVVHRDHGGGVHAHILTARYDLASGRSLNIAPPVGG